MVSVAAHTRLQAQARSDLTADMRKAVTRAEALFRGAAMHTHKFLRVGVDASLSLELAAAMFAAAWFPVHALCAHVLKRGGPAPELKGRCLDILQVCECTIGWF